MSNSRSIAGIMEISFKPKSISIPSFKSFWFPAPQYEGISERDLQFLILRAKLEILEHWQMLLEHLFIPPPDYKKAGDIIKWKEEKQKLDAAGN